MKLMLSIVIALMSVPTFAAETTGLCQKEAEAYVEAFESKMVDMESFAQGDSPWLETSVVVTKSTAGTDSTDELFTIYVHHSNEDDQVWTQDYTVLMQRYVSADSVSCYISKFNYLGSAAGDSQDDGNEEL